MSELEKSSEAIKHKQENLQAINKDINEKLSLTKEKKAEVDKKKVDLLNEKEKIANKIKENEEKLISHQLSIVYSDNPTYSQLNDAIINLKGLLPQISTASVKSKINSAISEAQYNLSLMNNNSNSSNDDSNTSYKATYQMEATAYYGHGITAMGTKPVRDPNGLSTVAVDKTVIPLGSKLYIPGYGYAIAADTGGAIKQMKIDLFMNTREECYAFGRRNVTVHVIAYPGEW
ncbi:MAG: 3D domain-containing protein [Clostridium paraputrificum]